MFKYLNENKIISYIYLIVFDCIYIFIITNYEK